MTRLRVTICVLLAIEASSVAACVPGPLCADAQADAKSFVEIPAIAEIDDACQWDWPAERAQSMAARGPSEDGVAEMVGASMAITAAADRTSKNATGYRGAAVAGSSAGRWLPRWHV